jgi:hypothetical protein
MKVPSHFVCVVPLALSKLFLIAVLSQSIVGGAKTTFSGIHEEPRYRSAA